MRVVIGDAKERLEHLQETLSAKRKHVNWCKKEFGTNDNITFRERKKVEGIEAEVKSILDGGSFQGESPEAYWIRRCHELTEELFLLETGGDPSCPLESANFQASQNKKIRQLDTARAVVNRSTVSVDVDVRQISQTLIVF